MTETDASCSGGWEVEDEDLPRVTHTPTGCAEVRTLKEQQTVNEPRLGHLGAGLPTDLFNSLPLPHLDIHIS